MSSLEKRRHGRVPVALDVTQSSRGRVSTIQARNIGFGGMQVEVPEGSFRWGDRLSLEFRLPVSGARLLADAEVVYKTNGIAGLRFIYVPRTMRRSLDDYISSRLAGSWFI